MTEHLDDHEWIDGLLTDSDVPPPPSGWDRYEAAVRSRIHPTPVKHFPLRRAAAATILLAVLTGFIWSASAPGPQAPWTERLSDYPALSDRERLDLLSDIEKDGDAGLQSLAAALQEGDPMTRMGAALALSALKRDAVRDLLFEIARDEGLLAGEDWVLQDFNREADDVRDLFQVLGGDDVELDAGTRTWAIASVVELAGPDSSAPPALRREIRDRVILLLTSEVPARIRTGLDLAEGLLDPAFAPALRMHLEDPDFGARAKSILDSLPHPIDPQQVH